MANAVHHAGTDAVVRLYRRPARVRVEVRDRSPRLPVRRRYSEHATTGRGLHLVDSLSAAWGVEPAVDGKVVWFELAETTGDEQAPGDAIPVDDLGEERGRCGSSPSYNGPAHFAPSGHQGQGSDASPSCRGRGSRTMSGFDCVEVRNLGVP